MRKLNAFIFKTALVMLLMASLIFTVDHNKVAQADEPELINIPGSFSGTFGLFSDYRLRGITQNDEDLALQGSLDWNHEMGYYFGAWASNVDFGDTAQSEVDLYLGVAREYWGSPLISVEFTTLTPVPSKLWGTTTLNISLACLTSFP